MSTSILDFFCVFFLQALALQSCVRWKQGLATVAMATVFKVFFKYRLRKQVLSDKVDKIDVVSVAWLWKQVVLDGSK